MDIFITTRVEPRRLIPTVPTNWNKGSGPSDSTNASESLDALDNAFDMPSWGHSVVLGAAVGEALGLARCVALDVRPIIIGQYVVADFIKHIRLTTLTLIDALVLMAWPFDRHTQRVCREVPDAIIPDSATATRRRR